MEGAQQVQVQSTQTYDLNLDDLPNETLANILHFCDFSTLTAALLVSRNWKLLSAKEIENRVYAISRITAGLLFEERQLRFSSTHTQEMMEAHGLFKPEKLSPSILFEIAFRVKCFPLMFRWFEGY